MTALEYPSEWRFEPPAIEIPTEAHGAFLALIEKIGAGGRAYRVYETFKEHFGRSGPSSNVSFAEQDMERAMSGALGDAVGYLDRFWAALEELQGMDIQTPPPRVLNAILSKHGVPLVIELPYLQLVGADAVVTTATTATSSVPARSDRFVLGTRIGQGGFGTVYEATRTTSVAAFEYAIKLLDPSPFVDDHEKAAKRFARESRVLQRLQHRAIVPYIEAGMIDAQQAYILMPHIDGTTLRKTPMSVDSVLWTFREILGGLDYLHGQQIIHRDLKPSNVIVRTSDHQPLILDFGCAYLFDDTEATLTTTHLGSAGYVPLEVIANPTMRDARQDVYACGVMLYEMLRGHLPIADEYVPLADVNAGFAPIDDLVRDAIAPFSKRLPTARAFLERLIEVAPNAQWTDYEEMASTS